MLAVRRVLARCYCNLLHQVSKGRGGAACGPSRLGRSQPGSPTAAYAAAAGLCGDVRQPRDSVPLGTLSGLAAAAGAGSMLHTQLRQQQQQSRVSLGSNTSSTPAGLLISPGVAALANKYATSSVGGSSVGALTMPEQPSTGVRHMYGLCVPGIMALCAED